MTTAPLCGFRLSAQQRRLWLLHRQGLPCAARCAVRITGDLDPGRLRASFAAAVERHEILRARFVRRPGLRVPVLAVGDPVPPTWRETDLRALGAAQREAEAERLWRQERLEPADLERPVPALDLELAHLEPRAWELLVTLPALCADGPTFERLVAEVAGRHGGEESAEEPLQFLDYADWHNELLDSTAGDGEARRERERRRADLLARLGLELPLERRSAIPAWRSEAVPVPLDRDLAADLRAAAAAAGVAPGTWVLAGWAALALRQAGRTDLAAGLVLDGRTAEDVQDILGPLARCVPARLTLEPDLPFAAALRLTAEAERQAAAELERFVWDELAAEAAVPPRCALGFESIESPAPRTAGGATFRILRRRAPVDSFTAQLAAIDDRASLSLELRVDPGNLRPADAGLLAQQLAALLRDAVARPQAALGELSLLDAAERRRVLGDVNAVAASGEGSFVHRRFAEQARLSPHAVAVVCEEREITFGELAARSAALARRLRSLGVGPEVRVGLFLERSIEMVVGLLGVLEAGGCYVPLDPLLPAARRAAILAAARPRVVVTERGLAAGLPAGERILAVDAPGEDPDPGAVPGPPLAAANSAYVLFTSGSTGSPKGVVVEHRQIAGYVAAVMGRLELPGGTSFATVSTLAADLGNTAIFPALCTGGTLHVLTHRQAGDAAALEAHLARRPFDALKIVPSHLAALLASARSPRALLPRCVVLGGESFGWELAAKLRALAPELQVFNHYGPTEATVGAVCGRLERQDEHSATVPLGRPLAHSRILILAPDGALLPRAVAGELCIGGGGVARGYLDDPRQTAERFVPDPSGAAGGRLYRTGDLARWLPDGRLEFLGRRDDQVKIRGFRIEPGEVAAALAAHPALREAAVVARTASSGERCLVAYFVERTGRSAAGHELRDFLRERLPEHMLPAAFVPLAFLPRTPNGKLDRQALPAPADGRAGSGLPYVAPRSEAEQAVSSIWEEVLPVERVGLHDNFFDLGGHSLHMVQVQRRVQDRFHRQVSIVELFRYPTVSALAGFLSDGLAPAAAGGTGEDRAAARKAALDRWRSPDGALQVDDA